MTAWLYPPVAEGDRELRERSNGQPERKRLEEVVLVEADRLCDELADRAFLGGQRRWERLRLPWRAASLAGGLGHVRTCVWSGSSG
jgi:hypothetical protein